MATARFSERFPVRNTAAARALARNVRRLRAVRGLTQDALADAIDAEQVSISRIENQRANPELETLERLAEALGVGVFDLFRPGRGTRS
jgi:transcriptional regulator with XRE-family HTH domain